MPPKDSLCVHIVVPKTLATADSDPGMYKSTGTVTITAEPLPPRNTSHKLHLKDSPKSPLKHSNASSKPSSLLSSSSLAALGPPSDTATSQPPAALTRAAQTQNLPKPSHTPATSLHHLERACTNASDDPQGNHAALSALVKAPSRRQLCTLYASLLNHSTDSTQGLHQVSPTSTNINPIASSSPLSNQSTTPFAEPEKPENSDAYPPLHSEDASSSLNNSGFLDYDEQDSSRFARSKRAAQLASRIINLDVARQTAVSANLWQTPNQPTKAAGPIAMDPATPGSALEQQLVKNFNRKVNPSFETVVRAQRARANLELHFDLMDACQQFASVHDVKQPLPSSLAIYNPLQTIRSREARASNGPKLHSKARAAINFSKLDSKSLASHPSCHWEITPADLILDYSWRCQVFKSKIGSDGLPSRHFSKDLKSQQIAAADLNQAFSLRNLNQISSKTLASRLLKLKDPLESKSVAKTASKIRTPPSSRRHSAVQLGEEENAVSRLKDQSPPTDALAHQLSQGSPASGSSSIHDHSSKSMSSTSHKTPSTSNHSVKLRKHLASESAAIQQTAAEIQRLELKFLLRNFTTDTRQDPYLCRYSHVCTHEKRAKHLSSDYNAHVSNVLRGVVPRVSSNVSNTEAQIRTMINTRLSTTSTRIDKLMVDSDRTCNRLATTLSLEIKQLSERLDDLERCRNAIKLKWMVVHCGYSLLEYVLRMLMWIVWGFVSVLLGVKLSVRMVFKTIGWLLWV